jgi:hypothetical protein
MRVLAGTPQTETEIYCSCSPIAKREPVMPFQPKPFNVSVPQSDLDDLKAARCVVTRMPHSSDLIAEDQRLPLACTYLRNVP